jgi:outer membrane cobalamin receptor
VRSTPFKIDTNHTAFHVKKCPFRINYVYAGIVLSLISLCGDAYGQKDSLGNRIFSVDINEFSSTSLGAGVDEANNTSLSLLDRNDLRESNTNIIVFNEQQIRASGARDLMELLRFVPGLSLGRDVDDVIGVGMRGLWAQEGKVLFLYDGIPLNEFDFGTCALGSRFELDNIQRVEIINGPGSVFFGGTAALGVVNIISKSAADHEGVFVTAKEAYNKSGINRQALTFSGNHLSQNKTEISYSISMLNGMRSSNKFTTPSWIERNLADSTDINNIESFIKVTQGNFSGRVFMNNFDFEVSDRAYSTRMRNLGVVLEYNKKYKSKNEFRLIGAASDQLPWHYYNTIQPDLLASNTSLKRYSISATNLSHINRSFSFTFGLQSWYQNSYHVFSEELNNSSITNRRVMFDVAAFGILRYKGKIGVLDLSTRGEYMHFVDPEIAPMISYVLARKKFHVKLNFAKSFKLPTAENINLGPEDAEMLTERVTTFDVQMGCVLHNNLKFQTNIYRNLIVQPIVYVYDSQMLDNYINRDKTGTTGMDITLSQLTKTTSLYFNYSFYSPLFTSGLPETALPDVHQSFQGLANHKVSCFYSRKINNSLRLSANTHFQGRTTAYHLDANEELLLVEYKPTHSTDIYVDFSFSKISALNIRFGCNNILDKEWVVLPTYNSGIDPLPMFRRQFRLELSYNLAK